MSSTETSANVAARQRPAGMRSMIIIALMLHIPLFIYPVLRLCAWLDAGALVSLLVLLPVVMSQSISRWLLRDAKHPFKRGARHVADFILGASPIVLLVLLVMEAVVLIGLAAPRDAALTTLAIAAMVSLFGFVMAITPIVRKIRFTSSSLDRDLRFVQITDVHIGSRSEAFLAKVIEKVEAVSPEFLCITGDFIDAMGVTEDELADLKKLSCPVYFSIGNHERYEDLDDILVRLRNLGVKVLRSEAVQHRPDVQVIGIDDRDDALQVQRELLRVAVNEEGFKLVLYHRPTGLKAAADRNIDLLISGHTHNGQIFPFNLIVGRYFDRIEGMYQMGKARQYVSQGTGTWGPVMRVGTRSEITLFEIEAEETKDVA